MSCCKDFDDMFLPCTDNESYGKLACRNEDDVYIGSDLEPIKFCPWCGKPITDGSEEE